MNTELLKEWLDALRSGNYAQNRGTLRSRDSYCCLGVLCDVADPEGWETEPIRLDRSEVIQHRGEFQFLPYELLGVTGLGSNDPEVTIDEEAATWAVGRGLRWDEGDRYGVTTLNDHGLPFADIARLLEKEYLG